MRRELLLRSSRRADLAHGPGGADAERGLAGADQETASINS
jgi:hypothetical protein